MYLSYLPERLRLVAGVCGRTVNGRFNVTTIIQVLLH